MSTGGRLKGNSTGTGKPGERPDQGAHDTGDRNVGGRQAGAPEVPELPLDDDGNDARNIGG